MPDKAPSTCLTIGNFDGVHIGHQSILRSLSQNAKALGAKSVAMIFDPHPTQILSPQKAKPLIIPLEERIQLLKKFGCDEVVVEKFSTQYAQLSAEEFIKNLMKKFPLKEIHVGRLFRFGKQQSGTVDVLQKILEPQGVKIFSYEEVSHHGAVVSSSSVRDLIAQGDCKTAQIFLGRPFSLFGEVKHGEKLGRQLGFPTANLIPDVALVCPGKGIYACWALTSDGRRFAAAVNVGTRPTVSHEEKILIEAFLLEFNEDLYGQSIKIEFVEKLRSEERFNSLEELKIHIQKDIEKTKKVLL